MSDYLRPHGLQHARLLCPSHLLELAKTHVHLISDAIQPSRPLSSPSAPAFNLSQHQGLFKWSLPTMFLGVCWFQPDGSHPGSQVVAVRGGWGWSQLEGFLWWLQLALGWAVGWSPSTWPRCNLGSLIAWQLPSLLREDSVSMLCVHFLSYSPSRSCFHFR